ncbi:MAG: hypothetical protein PSV22_04420 [Pseudolabrys sp.]|nr:hypothetical protein [Pseudolabrys sp.]
MAPSPKRKATLDTDALLAEACEDHARLAARLTEADAERDARLIENDPSAVDMAEKAVAAAKGDMERCTRRIMLLEQKAAEELRQRQTKAHADLIERVEAKFKARDAIGEEIAAHLAALEGAFRRFLATNQEISAAWPFDPTDGLPALIDDSQIAAIRHEIYRISGRPFGGAQLPGASCPTPFTDTRPESVEPLVDRLKAATAYATTKMRAAKVRALPPVSAIEQAPVKIEATANTVEQPAPVAPIVTRNDNIPEYLFRVDFVHMQTRAPRTEEVLFGPAEVAEAFLDGIGPAGKRGSEIAMRLAIARAPEGFILKEGTNAIRLDMARLQQSINAD